MDVSTQEGFKVEAEPKEEKVKIETELEEEVKMKTETTDDSMLHRRPRFLIRDRSRSPMNDIWGRGIVKMETEPNEEKVKMETEPKEETVNMKTDTQEETEACLGQTSGEVVKTEPKEDVVKNRFSSDNPMRESCTTFLPMPRLPQCAQKQPLTHNKPWLATPWPDTGAVNIILHLGFLPSYNFRIL